MELQQIKDFPAYVVSKDGRVYSTNGGDLRELVPIVWHKEAANRRYPRVRLWNSGKQKCVRVHLLVAEAFLGPRPRGHVVKHLDGVKANAAVSNLGYMTHAASLEHDRLNGRRSPHVRAKRTRYNAERVRPSAVKLLPSDVASIRAEKGADEAISCGDLAAKYGVSRQQIHRIVTGHAWPQLIDALGQAVWD